MSRFLDRLTFFEASRRARNAPSLPTSGPEADRAGDDANRSTGRPQNGQSPTMSSFAKGQRKSSGRKRA